MRRNPAYRRAQVMELHLLGCSNRQVRELLRINRNLMAQDQKALGIKLRNDNAGWAAVTAKSSERAETMAAMYRSGKTLQDIGDFHGLTRERVRQIISKYTDVTANDGGAHIVAEKRRRRREEKAEALCMEKNGCTRAQLKQLRDMGRELVSSGESWHRSPIGAFVNQRSSADWRGIEWKLKLWDWWTIWDRSGKWDRRGRGSDEYVMCRFGDTGGYELGNVYIATVKHNASVQPNNPYRLGHPDHDAVMAELAERRESQAAA